MFFFNKLGRMEYEKFWDFICFNFKDRRKSMVREMFGLLDFKQSSVVDLNIVKEMFNPRNHHDVKSGRKTLEEVMINFSDYITTFPVLYQENTELTPVKFMEFFKFISVYIKQDKNFKNFIEFCFRYNEIKNYQNFNERFTKSKIDISKRTIQSRSELASLKTNLQPNNVLLLLEEQITKKGNKGYINFYKGLKGNDHDNDNHLYFKEWLKTLKDQRIILKEGQVRSLFKHYSNFPQKLNYELLLERLVPAFSQSRVELLKKLYQKLFKGETTNELSFYKLQSGFNSRNHPDFKSGRKADYELKSEFLESFQTFLVNFQANYTSLGIFAFIRFFEFYARDWSDEYFLNVLESCFNLKSFKPINRSTPFGTDDNIVKIQTKKYKPKINYPYYVDETRDERKFKKKLVPKIELENSNNYMKSNENQNESNKSLNESELKSNQKPVNVEPKIIHQNKSILSHQSILRSKLSNQPPRSKIQSMRSNRTHRLELKGFR